MRKLLFIMVLLFITTPFSFSQNWQYYDSLGFVYQQQQNYDSALVYAEKAVYFAKIQVGKKHPYYVTSLNNLAQLYNAMGNYSKAEPLYIETMNIYKEALGEKHPDYAASLNNLAALYYAMGNYSKVEPLYIEAMNIQKEVLGDKHPDYANSLNNLANLYNAMGNYSKAEPLYLEAMNIRKEAIGDKHPDYANSLNNLARLYYSMGNYSKAESLYIQAMNIRKESLGEKHPDYAKSLNNLALLYYSMGNYSKAEPLYIEAMNIFKETLGEKHPSYTTSLNNLANLYNTMDNYYKSEPLYIEAMNIQKESLGEKHPDYANSLNNLAGLYDAMGNYSKAEPLYIEALNIRKESLGEKHPDYATSLNCLAGLYYSMGNYSKAMPLYIQALNIRKEVLGEKHSNYAGSLNNLAVLYNAMGNYSKAEPLYIEAMNIYKETIGEKHHDYVGTLNNLALLYRAMGNYFKAEPLYIEALNIRKEALGEKHPDYASLLYNLANLYSTMGNYSKAEPLYIKAMNIINYNIIRNFTFLSEKEKELYFNTQTIAISNFNSFVLKRKQKNPAIVEEVYNNAIKNKGLLLKSSTAMRFAILNSNDTALIAKYNDWIILKKEISNLYSQEISKRTQNPEELEKQANVIEKELVRGSQVFSDFEKLQNLTWESVKENLKSDEAAIEFLRIPINNDSITYCALIVKPNSKYPEMLQLFNEKELENIIGKNEHNNPEYFNDIYGTNDNTNEALYNLIFKPIEKQLADVKTIYYSPDGLLNKISFAALANGKNLFLCDNYKLQQLSSTGKLAMKENENIVHNVSACLYGGINFASDSTGKESWKYIPGTKYETDKIEKILNSKNIKTTYLTGSYAKEEEFKSSSSEFNIIHLATHGFFFNKTENEKNKFSEKMMAFRSFNSDFDKAQFTKNDNPLMRSGLVLADANKSWSKQYFGSDDDGILTALEISQLDLHKTQLVVLSACETGLGEIKGSEGVYGLQRAFKMAGVKFLIMSLWQVPDKETSEFMTTFYTKLIETKNIRTAFNNTQKEMRQKYDPYYWGAFVLIE